jgi:hypothetical protein
MKVATFVTNYDNSGLHTIDTVLNLMLDSPSYRGLVPAEHGGMCTNIATCPIRLNDGIPLFAQLIVCSATALLSQLSFYLHRTSHFTTFEFFFLLSVTGRPNHF